MKSRGKHGIDRETYNQQAFLYAARSNSLPHAKANPDVVREIRANRQGLPRWRLAELFGLSLRAVDKIATYETWKHVI